MPRVILSLAILAIMTGGLLAADAAPTVPATTLSPAATAPAEATPPATPTEPNVAQKRAAIEREVRDIVTRFLGSADPVKQEEGRLRLLQIHDPAATEPIVRLVGVGDPNSRQLACEALGQIPGDEAAKFLAKSVLADESEPVRSMALKSIKARSDHLALPYLVNGLNSQGPAYPRAALALAEVGDLQAALAMLGVLRRQEQRVIEVVQTTQNQPSMFSGTVMAYVAGAHAVASGGVVAVVPDIATIGGGTGFGSGSTAPKTEVVKKTVLVTVEQPIILDALKKITGQDFGFNTYQWRNWIQDALTKEKAAKKAAETPKPLPAATPIPPPPLP
jgi:hypothetical protein